MQSIGERLEEARKRKGISLREAAEATKIRSDFLGYIEQNKFDFDLPEIYKKGFIGNYARYLKLNPEKLLTDYHAQQLSSSRLGKKNGAEWFGKMEIKSAAQEQAEVEEGVENASYGRIATPPAAVAPAEPDPGEDRDDEDQEGDKMFYLKAGLVFVGTLALVFILFGLVKAILGGSKPDPVSLPDSPTATAPVTRNLACRRLRRPMTQQPCRAVIPSLWKPPAPSTSWCVKPAMSKSCTAAHWEPVSPPPSPNRARSTSSSPPVKT